MAKNWTIAEASAELASKSKKNENIQDFGRRFPLTTNILTRAIAGDTDAVNEFLAAIPVHMTMNKMEKIFKEGVSDAPVDDEEETETEQPAMNEPVEPAPKKQTGKAKKPAPVETEDEADDDLESKSLKALWEIMKELGITKKETPEIKKMKAPDKKAKFIEFIREARGGETADAEDEAEEDAEETSGEDYSKMSATELYKLCKSKGIKAETRKPAKYYIDLLNKAEEDTDEEDDWDDGEEEEEKPAKAPAKSKKEKAAPKASGKGKPAAKKPAPVEDEDDDDDWDV